MLNSSSIAKASACQMLDLLTLLHTPCCRCPPRSAGDGAGGGNNNIVAGAQPAANGEQQRMQWLISADDHEASTPAALARRWEAVLALRQATPSQPPSSAQLAMERRLLSLVAARNTAQPRRLCACNSSRGSVALASIP
jgi:hypothetical protein